MKKLKKKINLIVPLRVFRWFSDTYCVDRGLDRIMSTLLPFPPGPPHLPPPHYPYNI